MNSKRKIPWWVVLICLSTLVFGIAGHALWTADEPREAEIAREMAGVITGRVGDDGQPVRDSWAVPYLAGKPFVEKPPLYYWLSALMMLSAGKLIGSTVAARALSALSGALTLWVLWSTLREYLGCYRALAGTLILATMAGFFMASHWILIDPFLVFLNTVSVLFLFRGVDRDRPLLVLGAYLAAGLAFLTKGFVAWGLLSVPWATLLVVYFRKFLARPLLHLAGFLLLVGPGFGWAAVFHSQGGTELWEEWFINNNIGRFSGDTTHSHIRGPFYYLGSAPVLLLPWTILLVGRLFSLRRKTGREKDRGERAILRIAVAWALGGIVLLSLAGTKREIYLYPLLPGFAVLAALSLDAVPSWVGGVYRGFTAILLVPMIFISFFEPVLGPCFQIAFRINLPALIFAAAGVFSFFRFKRDLLPQVAAVSGFFYLTAIFAVFPLIDAEKNYEPATRRLAGVVENAGLRGVCGWHIDETTRAVFAYYTGLTLINLRDKVHPEKNLGRLAEILNGEDSEYDAVIVLLKGDREFPPEGMPPARYQVRAEERMGRNRRLLLITGLSDSSGEE